MTDKLHICAWEKMKIRGHGMAFIRRVAEYPITVAGQVEQLDGRPEAWDAHPDRPRTLWTAWHPVTGEQVGGSGDSIVPAMQKVNEQLAEWGLVLLGDAVRHNQLEAATDG
jgi:hypothetical protein